jgi:hypothetical protein
MAANVALHKNRIYIYQNVNGDISFHLTAQENGVRRRTILYDVTQFLIAIFTPVRAKMSHNLFAIFTTVRATSSVALYCTPLYN